jgi:pimeloyl-ACP methyl ester carboxylesterase
MGVERMKIIDRGSGIPVVLVPGIQGRWEWMRPAVDALARRCRVITFSLADEPTSGASFDAAAGFDSYLRQVNDALDAAAVPSAIICGISYGGLIAASFAARYPHRTSGVVVVSAIPPSWVPDRRVRFLIQAPRLLSPVFCVNSLRLFKEMAVAKEGVRSGLAFAARHLATVVRHRFSPGEAELDRVVPVSLTRDYLRLWPRAQAVCIARSGHLGSITRPDEFAELVTSFAGSIRHQSDQRRRIVG